MLHSRGAVFGPQLGINSTAPLPGPPAVPPPLPQTIQRQLSCWLRNLVAVQPSFGAAQASLAQFFKAQGAAPRRVSRASGGGLGLGASMLLVCLFCACQT
jgi:hypothetical protein